MNNPRLVSIRRTTTVRVSKTLDLVVNRITQVCKVCPLRSVRLDTDSEISACWFHVDKVLLQIVCQHRYGCWLQDAFEGSYRSDMKDGDTCRRLSEAKELRELGQHNTCLLYVLG